ncbi:DUF6479 family protein [Streptomyces sp. NPDC091292]|uniref:DUF6479 family protein n=1 Tax=Streptomyces sp. NPDC091292 TaxID=3365991 RepID=UPI00382A41C4
MSTHLVLAAPDGLLVIGPFIIGAVMVVALIWIVWLGIRMRSREPGPPSADQQPHLPDTGAVHEVSERREPDEVPFEKDGGLNPYQLHGNLPNKRSDDQRRRRWTPGHGGSFGSGGAGAM